MKLMEQANEGFEAAKALGFGAEAKDWLQASVELGKSSPSALGGLLAGAICLDQSSGLVAEMLFGAWREIERHGYDEEAPLSPSEVGCAWMKAALAAREPADGGAKLSEIQKSVSHCCLAKPNWRYLACDSMKNPQLGKQPWEVLMLQAAKGFALGLIGKGQAFEPKGSI